MRCIHALRPVVFFVWPALLTALAPSVHSEAPRPDSPPTVTDSVYNANHPRLLYNPAEIPALFDKVRDGGNDDVAYSFIRLLIDLIYPGSTEQQLLEDGFGLSTIPNLGVGTALESPPDDAAREMGRTLTVYLADNWAPDSDDYNSSLRLRALSLGYDMFFENSTDPERSYVRDEIRSYVDTMLANGAYEVWSYRPYLSNRSAMIAASLGLAAICLNGETDSAVVQGALDRADELARTWLNYHVDGEGAYNEGSLYASWSLRNLAYYFWARIRYDGLDYSEDQKIRNMEKWLAYELLPEGGAHVNNIQDCTYLELPLAKHTTYFDWAQTAWSSSLSAYIWEHVAGMHGHNAGAEADKAGTVIWNQNLVPQQPDAVLPESMLWENRGLYYFRTGWPTGASSDDVLFSFYSGQFQGGHAQEDQNQFTLYGYGETWAMDHGPGQDPRQSEAHNMILIDGNGQHNAGSSIGTDGAVREYLLNDYADYLRGDATSAYTTHSPMNNPGFPFPGSDWSWGYGGANPVDHAYRTVFVVRDPSTPPYFIMIDDIEKDGLPHTYEWRLHTGRNNTIDTTANPIHLSRDGAFMDIHVLNPPFPSLQKTITYFNNRVPDPDSNILALSTTAVNPQFLFLLLPGDGTVTPPVVTSTDEPWGKVITVAWSGGETDVLLVNFSGGLVTYPLEIPAGSSGGLREPTASSARSHAVTVSLETDASLALLRLDGTNLERYVFAQVGTFTADGIDYVTINNGTATVGYSGTRIDIDRYDADFVFYAPGIADVFYRKQRIHVVENGGYLTRDLVAGAFGGIKNPRPLRVRAYPNPFNPSTTVVIELEKAARVAAAIFDAKGRLIKRLWSGELEPGLRELRWDGRNEAGQPMASGVYLLMITTGRHTETVKLAIIK